MNLVVTVAMTIDVIYESADNVCGEIPGYLGAIDQPSIDGFNTWCVSRLARREGMKVVLSGIGGDEWFGGYNSFTRLPILKRWHHSMGSLSGV